VPGRHDPARDDEREQLLGALIVDPPGPPSKDRVMVINIFGRLLDSTTYQNALAVNGRSWPYTERIQAGVGDTIRWRVVNSAFRPAIARDTTVLPWRLIAKDGADLPPARATLRRGGQRIQVGETWDFEWIPESGDYRLVIGDPREPLWVQRIISVPNPQSSVLGNRPQRVP
jgi:hypothetical protein